MRRNGLTWFAVIVWIGSCGGGLARGGATGALTVATSGGSLTVAQGTFDSDQTVDFDTLTEAGLTTAYNDRGGSIELVEGDSLDVAVQAVIGSGTTNVTLNQNLTVSLTTATSLTTSQSVELRAASLPSSVAVFCQVYDAGALGLLFQISEFDSVDEHRVTFQFGERLSISGFVCMLLTNRNSAAPARPTTTSARSPAVLEIRGDTSLEAMSVNPAYTTLTLAKTGDAPATDIAAEGLTDPFTFRGDAYPGTGGDCGETISADCTVVIKFLAPNIGVAYDTALVITYFDGVMTKRALATLTGIAN